MTKIYCQNESVKEEILDFLHNIYTGSVTEIDDCVLQLLDRPSEDTINQIYLEFTDDDLELSL